MKESGIGYGSINHPVDRDPVCGYTGIIGDYLSSVRQIPSTTATKTLSGFAVSHRLSSRYGRPLQQREKRRRFGIG